MHLVFLNQYYPPDAAPTGVMLQDLVGQLVREGHEVTVLCAVGGYAGEGEPSQLSTLNSQPSSLTPRIVRIGATSFGRGTFIGKLLDYASFYGGVAWKLGRLEPRPDRIVALTTPPYLSVLARLFSKIRSADHAHWVMDLYPDVMAAHGMLGEKSPVYRILVGLARWGFGGRRCAAVLTLGPDMSERVGKVISDQTAVIEEEIPHPSTSSVEWVPLWGPRGNENLKTEINSFSTIDSQPSISSMTLRRKRGWADGELIVMYSGNMGLGHRFGEILEAAKRLNIEHRTSNIEHRSEESDKSRGPERLLGVSNHQPPTLDHQLSSPTRFVFFGRGKRRAEIETFIAVNPGCAIELNGYAPAEELVAHLQSADVHLASLDDAWTGTMVPSKLQGIFSAGRPVIFIGSAASSIGRWVRESGGGWVVNPGDVTGFVAALNEARNSQDRLARGRAASAFAGEHFNREINVARVAAILTGPK